MSIEPGVVVGIDRDYTDVDGNRTGLVRGLLQSGAEIEAGFMGTPPWPLASALFDGGPDWVCLGPLGHRRTLVHDDFLGIGEVTTVDTLQDWTNYTPTLTQSGTVSKTITRARYRRMDDICFVEIDLAVTGSGTAGVAVEIGLPFSTGMATGSYLAGTGVITNASASSEKYVGAPRVSGSSTFTLQGAAQSVANPLGVDTFTEALASSDAVRASFWYSISGAGTGTPVYTTTDVDGWIVNNAGLLAYLSDEIDFAGTIQLLNTAPNRAYMRKKDRAIALSDDRVFWFSARLAGGSGTPLIRVGLADDRALDDGTAATSTDAAVYAQLDVSGGASNLLASTSGTSTSTVATGESYVSLPSPPTWIDVLVRGGQWAAMWVDGSGPWMLNTNIPSPDAGTRAVSPFVSVINQSGGNAVVAVDCVTVEQVSQAVSPYDLSLFSADFIADS